MVSVLLATNGSGYQIDKCLAISGFREAVTVVVSDRECGALAVSKRHGLEALNLNEPDSIALNAKIYDAAVSRRVDYVISPGFTRLFREPVIDHYERRIFNCHPSILPAFRGFYDTRDTLRRHHPRKIVERTLEFGSRVTGNTIHLVTKDVDGGYPVMVSTLHIPYDEQPWVTRHRLFVQECKCLLQLVCWLRRGQVCFDKDGRPYVAGATYEEPWFSPNLEDAEVRAFALPLPPNDGTRWSATGPGQNPGQTTEPFTRDKAAT